VFSKGQPVNSYTPIVRRFTKAIPPGPLSRHTLPPLSLVVSHIDADKLPLQVNKDANIVAEITVDLSGIPETVFKLVSFLSTDLLHLTVTKFLQKHRYWLNLGSTYRCCEYDIKFIMGDADVLFEAWINGRKISKDKPIPVEWTDMSG
jgi:hypothetical protein